MPHATRTFTLEAYAPCFPDKGIHVRTHRGTFEENRDTLSPSMIATREIVLTHPMQTVNREVKRFAKEQKATTIWRS